jgi:hypothetical protein
MSLVAYSSWKRCGRRGVNSAAAWRTEDGSTEDRRWIRFGLNRSTCGLLADSPGSQTRTVRNQCAFLDTDDPWPRPGRGLTERADCARRRRVRDSCLSTERSRPLRDADTVSSRTR